MEVKTIDQTLVCGISVRTCLSKLTEHVGVKPEAVMNEIAAQNIAPAGPQIWYYTDCGSICTDGEFNLLISVPVAAAGTDRNELTFTTLPEYRCASLLHNGSWSELPAAYAKLTKEIAEAGYTPVGTSREVYLSCDFENPDRCVTEIQLEIR